MAEVIEYFLDGKLLKWLHSHDYPEAKCAVIDLLYKRYKKFSKKTSNAEKISEIDAGELIRRLNNVSYEMSSEKKIDASKLIRQLSDVSDEIYDENKTNAAKKENLQLIEKRLEKIDAGEIISGSFCRRVYW